MRTRLQILVLLLLVRGIAVGQAPNPAPAQTQNPDQPQGTPDPSADPRDNRVRPLTPEEERERQIRQFDPLYRGDPNAPSTGSQDYGASAPPPEPAPQQQVPSNSPDAPLAGSIASSERLNAAANQNRGPQVVGDDDTDASQADYTGPAVLSRAYTVNRPMIAQDVKWNETFGFGFSFISGTVGAMLTSAGSIASSTSNAYGPTVTASFGGRKILRRDQLGIRFTGSWAEYLPSNGISNGPNMNMAADYSHIISRHWSFHMAGTGTMYSQNYSAQNPTVDPDISIANINLASSPNIQLFDTLTKQFNLQASTTWQINARVSINFGGGYFVIIRNGAGLLGAAGEQAQADVNYRLTKKTTVGLFYSYNHYDYQHGFGTSDSQSLGALYSYAFSRTLQLRLRGGASTVQTLGYTQIALPPVYAALLGISSTVVDDYTKNVSADLSGQLVKDLSAGRTASIAYTKGVSPGNGLYLTSEQQSMSVTYAMKVRRLWQMRISGSRDTLSAIGLGLNGQALGNYTSESVQLAISRTFGRSVSSNVVFSYRHYDITATTPVAAQYMVSMTMGWSPKNGKLWPF